MLVRLALFLPAAAASEVWTLAAKFDNWCGSSYDGGHPGQAGYSWADKAVALSAGALNWQKKAHGWRFKAASAEVCQVVCVALGDCAEVSVNKVWNKNSYWCYPARSKCLGIDLKASASKRKHVLEPCGPDGLWDLAPAGDDWCGSSYDPAGHPGQAGYSWKNKAAVLGAGATKWQKKKQGRRFKAATPDLCKAICIAMGDCAEVSVTKAGKSGAFWCYPAASKCEGTDLKASPSKAKFILDQSNAGCEQGPEDCAAVCANTRRRTNSADQRRLLFGKLPSVPYVHESLDEGGTGRSGGTGGLWDECQCDFVGKIASLADVHGDDGRFLEALQLGKIADAAGNWSGRQRTFVQTGDLIDRGDYTIQVFDLLMRLEQQAEAAGGKVHRILGNHDVMNLLGDLRYVSDGDFELFGGRDARALAFAKDGKYGKWLLKAKVCVEIGTTVYVHAGITGDFAKMGCDAINQKAEQELAATVPTVAEMIAGATAFNYPAAGSVSGWVESSYATRKVNAPMLRDSYGPVWFRGHGETPRMHWKNTTEEALATLDSPGCAKLKADFEELSRAANTTIERMVVGHTIYDDVQVLCGSSLVLADVAISRAYDYKKGYCSRANMVLIPEEGGAAELLPEKTKCDPSGLPPPPPNPFEGGPCDEYAWPDLDKHVICGECKVLVDDFDTRYGTCASYCERLSLLLGQTMTCAGAWEEDGDTCAVDHDLACDEFLDTSDALCACHPPGGIPSGLCDEESWPDVKNGCGDCKVLASNFYEYETCTAYCNAAGLTCAGAWEENDDDCLVWDTYTCDDKIEGTSDALCECHPPNMSPKDAIDPPLAMPVADKMVEPQPFGLHGPNTKDLYEEKPI